MLTSAIPGPKVDCSQQCSPAALQDASGNLIGTASGPSGNVRVDSRKIKVQNHFRDPLAQLAEHLPFKQGAAGSNPARVTSAFFGEGFRTMRVLEGSELVEDENHVT